MGSLLFRGDEAASCSLALFAPQHYESKYGYPLLVWLHGAGGDRRQIQRVMPLISMRNYVGVAPELGLGGREQCRLDCATADLPIEEAALAVDHAIETASERFHVRRDRVFLVGWEAGGTAALRLGLSDPVRYAGVVSLNGPFPTHARSLAQLDAARRLPLLLATGTDAVGYPQEQVCCDLRLLHAAGIQVALRQYPVGDELTTVMLSDINHWMMGIVTGSGLPK